MLLCCAEAVYKYVNGIFTPSENVPRQAAGRIFLVRVPGLMPRTSSLTGFTLIEVLLSIAAIVIIAGISIPIYQSFQIRNGLDIAATTVAQSMRRAQMLAQASDGDISWGVNVQNNSIIIFRGGNYLGRDSTYDEIFEMPTAIIVSGMAEVVFARFAGLPNSAGTTTLASNTNEVRNISINQKGMVNY